MNENMQPISRREKFLAKIAGEDVGDIQPITRREYWLNKIAKNSGGGVTSWNDLTDKPFGEEEIALLQDYYVEYSDYGMLLPEEIADDLINSTSANVVLDGVEYKNLIPTVEINNSEFDSTYYGNVYLSNPDGGLDTGEPFCIRVFHQSKEVKFIEDGAAVGHKVSISAKVLTPLDLKYLPEQLQIGEETVEKVIMDNVSTSSGPANDVEEGYGDEYGVLRISEMVPGDTYIVIVDGVEYRDVCRQVADETSDGGIGIEVFAPGGIPTEEIPVSLASYSNSMYINFPPNDMNTHTVTLIHLAKEITTLNPKYLPADIGGKLPVYKEADMDVETKVAFAKEYKRYISYSTSAYGTSSRIEMQTITGYEVSHSEGDCCCGTSEGWYLAGHSAGTGNYSAWSVNITEAQYNEIAEAWAAMIGTEV